VPKIYFDERIAARYDATSADIMTSRERWSGWNREPFTSDSTTHVSVWEKPP
jgi:hypothetical protein